MVCQFSYVISGYDNSCSIADYVQRHNEFPVDVITRDVTAQVEE